MDDTFFRGFTDAESERLRQLKQHVTDWCNKHQWQIGVVEMALGAACLSAAWETGAIQMSVDFVVHRLMPGWSAEITGGVSAVAGLATYFLGNIGVAAAGAAMCVPALAIAGGAALVFGLAGYGAAKLVQEFLHQAPSLAQGLTAASLVFIGVYLIKDGASRVPALRAGAARVKEAGLHLKRIASAFVVETNEDFRALVQNEIRPFLQSLAGGAPAALVGAATLGAAGAVAAPSFATFMGSNLLGPAAVSLGLVSAPVWPIVALAGCGLVVGFSVWKAFGGDSSAAPTPPPPPLTP